jgi:hypothetical protein
MFQADRREQSRRRLETTEARRDNARRRKAALTAARLQCRAIRVMCATE